MMLPEVLKEREEKRLKTISEKTHCIHGHEYTPENTIITAKGHRKCRMCSYLDNKKRRSEDYKPKTKEERAKKITNTSIFHKVKKYGLTVEDYNQMYQEQEGSCAICGEHQSKLTQSLSVDHCHLTNDIRGLLCTKCNSAIGFLNDDINLVAKALDYLNKYKTNE